MAAPQRKCNPRPGTSPGWPLGVALCLSAVGCGPTTAPLPAPCPDAPPPPLTTEKDGPTPPALSGHYVVQTIAPKGHAPAAPETYLLAPEEQAKCAFVRVVLSFEDETLKLLYEALCVEPEDRPKNPMPLKWCSTEATTHIAWDGKAFELPAPSGSRSNVQQLASWAAGSGPTDMAAERTVWGCKFNLDAQRFEIVGSTESELRLRAPKYGAEWVLVPTDEPSADVDDVVAKLRDIMHTPSP